MNCEKARKLILTDFADNELDAARMMAVTGHISSCPSCRQLAEDLAGSAIKPFASAAREEAPEHLWQGIRSVITGHRIPRGSFLPNLTNNLFGLRGIIVGSFSLAAAVLVFMLFASRPDKATVDTVQTASSRHSVESSLQADQDYFAYLYEELNEDYESDKGLGTAIEEHLL